MALVLLPDGTIKTSSQIIKNIVICTDGTEYYWNEYSENIIKATISVNSVPPIPYDKTKCGLVNSISYILSGVEYENTGNTIIYPHGGSGTDFSVKIETEKQTKYVLNNIEIVNGGTDYKIYDQVYNDILGYLTVDNTNTIQKNTIDQYSVSFDTSQHDSPLPATITSSGSTFSLDVTNSDRYEIDSISIINPGQNYETGDIITIPNIGSFELNVDYGTKNISSFSITSLQNTVYDRLSSYVNNLPSYNTSGNGSGATFKASYQEVWRASSCKLNLAGQGYKIGDYLYVSYGNTNYAYVTVTGVTVGTGAITSYHMLDNVVEVDKEIKNYLIHSSINTEETGGASFYVNSSIMDVYSLSDVEINNSGYGYVAGDIIYFSDSINPNLGNISVTISDVYDGGAVLSYTSTFTVNQLTQKPTQAIVTTSSGTGTGYTCTIQCTSKNYYILSSTTILDGGSGFNINESYSFPYGTISVSSVYSEGEILDYTKSVSGDWFYGSSGTKTVNITSGSGKGAVATVTVSTNKSDIVYFPSFTILQSGTNYYLNDIFNVYDSNNVLLGTINVQSVGANGNISSIEYYPIKVSQSISLSFEYLGSLKFNGEPTKTGSGFGFSASFVTTKNYFKLIDINLTSFGNDYAIGDILSVGSYGTLTVTSVSKNGALKDYTFVSSVPENNVTATPTANVSSGTDTATLNLIWTEIFMYNVVGITDVSLGSGYIVGDTITVGDYATLTITKVAQDGELKDITFTDSKTYYDDDESVKDEPAKVKHKDTSSKNSSSTNTYVTGSGTGATFDITYSPKQINAISSITLKDAGYGYTSGTTLTIGEYGTVMIDTVDTAFSSITDYEVTIDKTWRTWQIANSMNGYGGEGVTGSGATFNIGTVSGYQYTDLSLVNSGSGYNVNDILDIDGDTYSDNNYYSDGGIVKVTGVVKNSQPVKSISNIKTEIITDKIDGNINCNGGSGSGLVVQITYKPIQSYSISKITLLSSGINYSSGDKIDLNGYGTVTILSTKDTGGNIISVKQNIKTFDNDRQADMSGIYPITGGSGNGAMLRLSYIPEEYYVISNISINSSGYGYSNNDYLMLDNFQGISVTSIKNV